jgi:probable HAF family extracellular repeat protein
MRSRFATHSVALAAACLLMSALAASAHGARFIGLGGLPGGDSSYPTGVSADGSVVVGWGSSRSGGFEAFRWTSGGGMVGLGYLFGGYYSSTYARGVSADGLVVVGESSFLSFQEAFRWTSDGGMVGLGDLPGGNFQGSATSVSADGSVIVGNSESASGPVAFRWTSGGGMVGLGGVAYRGYPTSVSADGSVIVGTSGGAFRWTSDGGMVGLGHLPGEGYYSSAKGVSADGSVVVGGSSSTLGSEAFRWTSDGGMVGLGDGGMVGLGSVVREAIGVSADGTVIVGNIQSYTPPPFSHPQTDAFIWDATRGMRKLQDVLSDVLPPDDRATLNGWTSIAASAISADGLTVVGSGTNPSGIQQAWVAYLRSEVPEPASWMLMGIGLVVVLATRRASRFI